MTDLRKAAEQALEAFEKIYEGCGEVKKDNLSKHSNELATLVRKDCIPQINVLRQALVQLEQNESFLSCSIKDLNLHKRSINCLRAYSIETVGELCDKYPHEINKIPNLGKLSFKNIVEALAEHGLSLKKKNT